MARKEARIFTSIWAPESDFRSLSWQAQWVFFAVLSQPLLSYCGVILYTPERWTALAKGLTAKIVRAAVAEAAKGRFVVVDEQAQELWVRSFVRRDGILKSPNLVTAMGRDFEAIHSEPIREGFLAELPEGFPEGLPKGVIEGLPEPLRKGSRVRSAEPLSPYPCPPSSSSSVSDLQPALPQPEDEEEVIRRVARLLAERRLRDRDPTLPRIALPAAWLSTTAEQAFREILAPCLAWLAAKPETTAEELLSYLEPTDLGSGPGPMSYRPNLFPPCGSCDSTGWVETDAGMTPCPDCERVRQDVTA